MADTKQTDVPGTQPGAGDTVRGPAANEVPGTMRSAAGTEAKGTEGAARRAGGAAGRGGEESATAARQAGEGAERGGEAAREGMEAAASQGTRFLQGAAEEVEKTGRGLAGMVEEAAEGMRSLIGSQGFDAGSYQEAQQAMAQLIEGVMATNLRFADELLRRAGPSAVVDLQRRFLREYFDTLAQGGTLLVRAARGAAEQSPRPLEETMRGRGEDASAGSGGGQPGGTRGKVADLMSKDVKLASPDDTVQQAARAMGEQGTGVLPVGEDDRLVGVVTDRDLALRALATGKDPSKTKLREVMSGEPRYVFADEPIERAAASMAEQQVQRMPVLDREKRLVGILSLGDLVRGAGGGVAGQALSGISRQGGKHADGA